MCKNWWFQVAVQEKTLESPLDCKVKPISPKSKQPWMFIGRTDAEAEAPILWPPHVKSRLIGKDPDAGKDWRQEEKGTTEDEIVGWHHWLNGCEFEQAPGDGDGQESLVCCSPWGHSQTWLSNWTTTQIMWEQTVGRWWGAKCRSRDGSCWGRGYSNHPTERWPRTRSWETVRSSSVWS